MANREFYDLIIIGGGPAGLSAGIYALRASMRTVLIEKGAPGGQVSLSAEVENYPAIKKQSGYELAQSFLEHAQDYNLEVLAQEVTDLEPGLNFHTVRLDNDEVLKAHATILATGGSPRKLNIPGEDDFYGKGVSYCAVCDGFFFRNKTVAVIGGGDTASAICGKSMPGKLCFQLPTAVPPPWPQPTLSRSNAQPKDRNVE